MSAMAKIYPAENATIDSEVFAFVMEFPSGATKSAHWRQEAPVVDSLECAKALCATIIQSLLDTGRSDDVERTNWTSAAAAIQALVMTWNEKRREALYAVPPPQVIH